jgi:hypothetical protein
MVSNSLLHIYNSLGLKDAPSIDLDDPGNKDKGKYQCIPVEGAIFWAEMRAHTFDFIYKTL